MLAADRPALIAFDRTRDGAGRVATVRVGGGHVTIVAPATRGRTADANPAWRP